MNTARRLEFAVGMDEDGALFAEAQAELHPSAAWTPEHILLAALARCSFASLAYHAKRAGALADGRVTASGAVTRRTGDGRFAFVEEHVALDVTITPAPDADALVAMLTKAERDCFVGASLVSAPSYAWRVNGQGVETVAPSEMLARNQSQ